MPTPLVLDGRHAAQAVIDQARTLHDAYKKKYANTVSLGVVRIGNDPASQVYVQRKRQKAAELGLHFEELTLPASMAPKDVISRIQSLAARMSGVIVQLPVPPLHRAGDYLSQVPLDKDVDGLRRGSPMVPCTPLGCLYLLRYYDFDVGGKHCVVVGHSALVGRPLGQLLLDQDATVTMAHSRTVDLPSLTRQADFLFVATGKKHLITPQHVGEKAVVVDVGIHRTEQGLTGDVHPDVYPLVRTYTPVPGGVGPMTVATLMLNTVQAAIQQRKARLSKGA